MNKSPQIPQRPNELFSQASVIEPLGAVAKVHAVIPAAGFGQRFGPGAGGQVKPKQYHELAGEPVIVHSIRTLLSLVGIDCVWVVLAPSDREGPELLKQTFGAGNPRLRVCPQGGAQRRDSVLAGIRFAEAAGAEWVMVHDAARPLISRDALERLISTCLGLGHGGILALPVVDTVKRAQSILETNFIEQTVPREQLWLAQTPQCFPVRRLIAALERFAEVTDEASAMEQLGDPVVLVMGERSNIKLTYADDLQALELYLNRHTPSTLRVGEGYDVHALVPGRDLLLGGVKIDYPFGLLGHSDADVLLHAITDALLGAAGLGDIGVHFPDHDEAWRGANSGRLLSSTVQTISELGWSIENVDCTVIAQRPKLAPYREAIVASIANHLSLAKASVNFKAKTQELLGFEGRGEGISARAVALLSKGSEQG